MHHYVRLMRPIEWVKNVIVLAGPAFGMKLWEPEVVFIFAAFCLAASSCYVINDLADREADREHPTKRNRPIASGVVSPASAVVFAALLIGVAIGMTYAFLPIRAMLAVAAYFVLILAYSFVLKRRPIADVIVIAIGFVLRAVGGAEAVQVEVSPWLIACTFTLCMFLGFGKRRCELATLTDQAEAGAHRATLRRYSPQLLSQLTSVSAGIAIMTFLLYTMDSSAAGVHPPFRRDLLLYTLPLVAYALFRYTMLVESGRFTGPTQIVKEDLGLVLTGLIWIAVVGAILALTHGSTPTSGGQGNAYGTHNANSSQLMNT